MKLVLIDHSSVPPDNFRFTHPETGFKHESTDEKKWLKAIKDYREDNGFPPIDAADIWDQFCKLLPPGLCRYENGDRPTWFVNTRLGVRDVLRGTQALASFIASGMQKVSKEKASERALICSRCYYNVPTQGCAPCVNLASTIVGISGDNKTPSDASLRSCAVCLCSTQAKVWMRIEDIAKSTTEEQMQRFPDFCWQKQELTQQEESVNQRTET